VKNAEVGLKNWKVGLKNAVFPANNGNAGCKIIQNPNKMRDLGWKWAF
jgi:hypothetical protein